MEEYHGDMFRPPRLDSPSSPRRQSSDEIMRPTEHHSGLVASDSERLSEIFNRLETLQKSVDRILGILDTSDTTVWISMVLDNFMFDVIWDRRLAHRTAMMLEKRVS
jgi:hypothetical protein